VAEVKASTSALLGAAYSLDITRNYTTERVRLRTQLVTAAELVRGSGITTGPALNDGTNSLTAANIFAGSGLLVGQRTVTEFRVLANSVANIEARIRAEFVTLAGADRQFTKIPSFALLGDTNSLLFSGLYRNIGSGLNEGKNAIDSDPSARIVFGFDTTEKGYYVLPATNGAFNTVNLDTLAGIDYYVIMLTSGNINTDSRGVLSTSGFEFGSSGVADLELFTGTGTNPSPDPIENHLPFLMIDAVTGQIRILSDDLPDFAAANLPATFEIEVFSRVVLDIAGDGTKNDIDFVVSHDVTLFKNPATE